VRKLFINCLVVILIFASIAVAQNYFPTENIRDSKGRVIDPAESSSQLDSTQLQEEIVDQLKVLNIYMSKLTGEEITVDDIN